MIEYRKRCSDARSAPVSVIVNQDSSFGMDKWMAPVAKSLRSELLKRSNAMILFVAGKRFSPWVTLEHTGRGGGRIARLADIARLVLGDAEKGRAYAEKRLGGRRPAPA
jgi:hypothetical protein